MKFIAFLLLALLSTISQAVEPDTINVPLKILCIPEYTQGYIVSNNGVVTNWYSKDTPRSQLPPNAVPVRNVTEAMKRQVYLNANVPYGDRKMCSLGYEVDHRIMLGVAGSNNLSNLQLQAYCNFKQLTKGKDGLPIYKGLYDAYAKDKVEDSLRKEVCAGTIKLSDAQAKLRSWKNKPMN
jgi:hypothetical protein